MSTIRIFSERSRPGQHRPGGQTRLRGSAGLFLLVIAGLLLSACQLLQTQPEDEPEELPEQVEETAAPESPPLPQPASLQQVVEALELGRIDNAEQMLLDIIDARPGSRLALRFLEQIQADPVELMGTDYEKVVVARGESLSVIAARELGDPMQFFGLARYNDLAVPRLLSPGMTLKIPQRLKAEPELPVEDVTPVVGADYVPGSGLAHAAGQLVESERYLQAVGLLLPAARAGNLDAEGELLLAEAAVARSRQLVEQDDPGGGLGLLNRAHDVVAGPARAELQPEIDRLQARELHARGVEHRRAGGMEQALDLFARAVQLDPDFEAAADEFFGLREMMVLRLHEQALIHYRQHRLTEAIELWQEVEALDKSFEPAQVYLARARALKSRLRELDE